MAQFQISRRRFLTGAAVTGASFPLAGCFDPLADRDNGIRDFMEAANGLTYRAQRSLLEHDDLAREYPASEIRQQMRPNGTTMPRDLDYIQLVGNNFLDYRLPVTGLVNRPLSLSLEELRNMPSRTQITRHDCVEGWSVIAQWTGVPFAFILDQAEVKPEARFVVFSCFDTMEQGFTGPIKYYESIDMWGARHPQTILAYGLNGERLPVPNGAPLRVRLELQLGYKMAKYIRAIEVTDTLSTHGDGAGGYWEDRGYEWYAGI
jgi:DMSO/TMAO reductase YedYZ molybdopterin-dependent catalytic subunit